jgi:hypothetical protein
MHFAPQCCSALLLPPHQRFSPLYLSEDFKLAYKWNLINHIAVRLPRILIDLSYFNCRNLQFAKSSIKRASPLKGSLYPRLRLQNALLCRYNSFAHNALATRTINTAALCVYFMRKLISLTSYLKNVFKHSLSPKKSQHCAAFCCCSRARLYIYSRAVMINCG